MAAGTAGQPETRDGGGKAPPPFLVRMIQAAVAVVTVPLPLGARRPSRWQIA